MTRLRYFPIILLFAIHAAFLFPLFQPGLYQSHDGQLHVARFAAYYKAFLDNQIPPRWASDLNFHYGTPLLIFYYPLPGYLGSLLHGFFRINFQDSFKIIIALSFIIAPLAFYWWMREKFSHIIALTASLLYGLAPYHLLDLYVRGAISDLLAFVFIPLVFLAVEKIEKKPKIQYVLFGAVSYMFLVLSHNGLGLMFSFVIFFYCCMKLIKNPSLLIYYIPMLALGLSLSAFFWLPSLVEQQYTHSTLFLGNKFLTNFPTLTQLFYSPWGFGTDVMKQGGLSPQIGPIHLIIAIFGLGMVLKHANNRHAIVFWWSFLLIAIFLSLRVSSIVWGNNTMLQKFEFPWRFTALSSFACAAIAPYVLKAFRPALSVILMLILIVTASFPLNKVLSFQNRNDDFYLSYPSSTDFGAATTRWVASEPIRYPDSPIEIISGDAMITDLKRSSTKHAFTLIAQSDVTILDNTIYFPGWRAYIDDKQVPIEFQDTLHRGIITFKAPQGNHNVLISFHESPIRFVGDTITVLSFIFVIGLALRLKYRRKEGVRNE